MSLKVKTECLTMQNSEVFLIYLDNYTLIIPVQGFTQGKIRDLHHHLKLLPVMFPLHASQLLQ